MKSWDAKVEGTNWTLGELLGSIAIIPLLITAGIVLVRVKNYRTAEKEWNKWVESIDLPYPEDKLGEEELENLVIKAQALLNDGLL